MTGALLAIHGLLHTLGFLKAWNLAAVPQLSGRTTVPLSPAAVRAVGALWLVAALALVAAAVLRWLGRDAWWMVAAPALGLSQLLIVLQWSDAWAGTIANVLVAVAVAASAGISRFHAENADHVRALLARAPRSEAPILRAEDAAGLPAPVQRWLHASGAVGRPRAQVVRLHQRGGMRTAPDQAYMPMEAEQYFTVDDPGFVWTVDVTMMRVVPVVGRDSFAAGRGRMLIKAGGLVTVADGTGPTFDQGTALRFLGEIVWFPSAAASPSIAWTAVDDRHAQATIATAGTTASALFEFDDRDRVVRLTADRYYGGRTLERWTIPITEWRAVRGVEIPVRGGAVWKLAAGDFDYFQWEIVDVEVNPAVG
ncbi:MAG: DUF6544 family protein [Vicinamibacterales bacterium]